MRGVAPSTGVNPHVPSPDLPEIRLWVCEDTTCTGQARAKLNPLDCPADGCKRELMLAPLSRQVAS